MPTDDLKEHATSSHDFYELLGVSFETSEADIRRAYRRTALKYHPDKNAGNPAAVEKFHLLQIAFDVLSDAGAKAAYDQARRARKEKHERDQAFEGRRRQMKEDLERRESGAFKRKRDEEDEEQNLEREIRRLAEDGKRRRKEREEMLSREKLEEEEKQDQDKNGVSETTSEPKQATKGGTAVSEIDRTIKARWVREGSGIDIDKDTLQKVFAKFGAVENAFMLKDKRQKIGDRKEKAMVATGVVVFSSVVGAHAAVADIKKQSGQEYKIFESVFWASNQEPGFLRQRNSASPAADEASAPATPSTTTKERHRHEIPGLDKPPTTPLKMSANGNGLRKAPSFASFSAANLSTPKSSPFSKQSAGSPSLEEITMIRLKNAEKRRLEEQIRKQDEEAAAAEDA